MDKIHRMGEGWRGMAGRGMDLPLAPSLQGRGMVALAHGEREWIPAEAGMTSA